MWTLLLFFQKAKEKTSVLSFRKSWEIIPVLNYRSKGENCGDIINLYCKKFQKMWR